MPGLIARWVFLGVVALSVAGGAARAPRMAAAQTVAQAEAPQDALPPGTINIALLGVDKRPTRSFRNTDVIMIASINPDIPSATVLSIPRDWPAYIPGYGVNKINQAYPLGGMKLFKATIQRNFGIAIDYYAMVNFEGLVRAVDTLGGVDVVATCRLYHVFPRDPYYMGGSIVAARYVDTFSGEVWEAGTRVPVTVIDIPEAGVYALNGLESLAFVRARYGVPGGDRDRGRREQRVARALLTKARQLDAIPRLPQLIGQLQDYVETDMPVDKLLYFIGISDRFNEAIIRSRFLDAGGANGAALALQGDAEGTQARAAWSRQVQQMLTVALNQRPNDGIPIEVWNGTSSPGFGLAAVDRLTELGFRVVDVKAADRLYNQTTVVDFTTTKKGSAIPLLTRTFGIRAKNVIAEPQPDGPRYRIIVGPDFKTCYYDDRFVLAQRGSRELPEQVEPEAAGPVTPTTASDYMPTAISTATVEVSPTVVLADAAAAAPGAPAIRVAARSEAQVNVRSGPGLGYAVIGTLHPELPVPLLGRSGDGRWLHVQLAKRDGWVAADYVVVKEPASAAAGPLSDQPPLAVVPSGDTVNVRAGPGVNYRAVTRLESRRLAPIVGRSPDGQWLQVRLDSGDGWVSAHLVRVIGSLLSAPVVQP